MDKKKRMKKIARVLFDENGRGIPFSGMNGEVEDANREFYVIQPEIDYAKVLARLRKFFGPKHKFIPVKEFKSRCAVVVEKIRNDPQIANLLKGPHFPFVIPRLAGTLGSILDDVIVPAMEQSYRAQFPNRAFVNYLHGKLAGKVDLIKGTRQNYLTDVMFYDAVCGVYFPVALQGFNIIAAREFITRLPDHLILSGMEAPVAVIAYPEILGHSHCTLGLDMGSLQWRSPEYALGFGAEVEDAHFGKRDLHADGGCSSGVSVLG